MVTAVTKIDDLSSDERKRVVAALGLHEASLRRAMKSAAPVVAEAFGKELVAVEALSLKFR